VARVEGVCARESCDARKRGARSGTLLGGGGGVGFTAQERARGKPAARPPWGALPCVDARGDGAEFGCRMTLEIRGRTSNLRAGRRGTVGCRLGRRPRVCSGTGAVVFADRGAQWTAAGSGKMTGILEFTNDRRRDVSRDTAARRGRACPPGRNTPAGSRRERPVAAQHRRTWPGPAGWPVLGGCLVPRRAATAGAVAGLARGVPEPAGTDLLAELPNGQF
jgi:hypothetical protein